MYAKSKLCYKTAVLSKVDQYTSQTVLGETLSSLGRYKEHLYFTSICFDSSVRDPAAQLAEFISFILPWALRQLDMHSMRAQAVFPGQVPPCLRSSTPREQHIHWLLI